jgi:hypothetical protein
MYVLISAVVLHRPATIFFLHLAAIYVTLCAEIQNNTVAYHVPFFFHKIKF